MNNIFTTTFYPQADGQSKRFNRSILAAIRLYVGDHPDDWEPYAEAITYAYNTKPHLTMGLAPFELALARSPLRLSIEQLPSLGPAPTPRLFKFR